MGSRAVNATPAASSGGAFMPVDLLWPHLPTDRLLGAGSGWIAVDKPSGVPESPDGGPGSMIHRASLHLGIAEEELALLLPPVVGQGRRHGDSTCCTGVVVIGQRGAMPPAHDSPEVQSVTWLAAVRDWPVLDRRAAAGLEQGLAAVGLRCAVWRHHGSRCVLELRAQDPGVGVPAQLAKLGFAVQGDRQGREASDPPLLLHRFRVARSTGVLEAAPPDALVAWLEGRAPGEQPRLAQALCSRYPLARRDGTNCFRLVDDEADLTLDRYGDDLVLSSYANLPGERAGADALQALIRRERDRAARIGEQLRARSTYLKIRPRQANTIVDATSAGLAPTEPVSGPAPSSERGGIVVENGLRYWTRLGAGLGTGLFLDQRDNRAWVQQLADGKRVLNTFAYTCAFSVAAAAGGARRTVSLDAARPALEIGRDNLRLNGFEDEEQHDIIRGDCFSWLPRMARRGDRFDLLILDPPSYSKVRKRRFSVLKDYADLVAQAVQLVDRGGWLLACVNHTKMSRRRLHQAVLDGLKRARRIAREVQHRPGTLDHPSGRMKSIAVQLD